MRPPTQVGRHAQLTLHLGVRRRLELALLVRVCKVASAALAVGLQSGRTLIALDELLLHGAERRCLQPCLPGINQQYAQVCAFLDGIASQVPPTTPTASATDHSKPPAHRGGEVHDPLGALLLAVLVQPLQAGAQGLEVLQCGGACSRRASSKARLNDVTLIWRCSACQQRPETNNHVCLHATSHITWLASPRPHRWDQNTPPGRAAAASCGQTGQRCRAWASEWWRTR